MCVHSGAEEEKIYQIFENFIMKGLMGEADECFALFEEPYSGIGLGEQGVLHNLSEVKAILRQGYRPMTGIKIKYEIQDFIVNFLDENAAVISGAVIISSTPEGGETMHSGVMQTLGVRRRAGNWTIGFTHASPMMLSQESIAAYPIKFADDTLSHLKAELQTDIFDIINTSFSGGIFGTYAREPFPLYFANDRFIEMLGYEREEFEEKFKDDTTAFNYIEDRDDMEEKSRQAYAAEDNYAITTRFYCKDGSIMWVEIQCRKTTDAEGNEIFLIIVTDITKIIELQKKTEEQNKTILESIDYASKIQRNLLPRDSALKKSFSDYAVIWEPRDIVGGDIFWQKNFKQGMVLCVCDCTGHGTPGALLSMLVISSFETTVNENNCSDTAAIMWELEKSLVSALNVDKDGDLDKKRSIIDFSDGCDIAAVFIAKDGTVTISAGNTQVFISDGKNVQQIKGQRLSIGDGKIKSKEEIHTITIAADLNNKFYIASDGLYDQIGEKGMKFGYKKFKDIILHNHSETLDTIAARIWKAFEEHRGKEMRRDDVELVAFKPKS